jgi:hypothetical protein
MMIPEAFEPLSLEDHVIVARINLCCAALAVLVFAFLVETWDWPVRTLAALASAGLILLARQIEPILRRLDPATNKRDQSRDPAEYYSHPF